MVGPLVNAAAILFGGAAGAFLGRRIPRRIGERLPLVFGCVAIGLGISMIVKATSLPPVVLSLILGTILGETIQLERLFRWIARMARRGVNALSPRKTGQADDDPVHAETFISATVLFCFSGVGIMGALTEGMTGDATLLFVKAIMDLFTTLVFAISLGASTAVLALPQTAVQMALFASASVILPHTTPEMIADFGACGGFIMIATGLTISGIKTFPLAGMLPSLLLVMPITALWSRFAP